MPSLPRLPSIPGPTLGGWQWWTDRRITPAGWRVQRHVVTGHHRLLNDRNWRLATGDLRSCLRGLKACPVSPPRDTVILLHGLSRTRRAMQRLGDHLRGSGFDVLNFSYASTRADVDLHARALCDVLGGLAVGTTVHFVGHSLGNLIVRRYFRLFPQKHGDLSWGNCVMLAPPNSGSALARWLHKTPVVRPFLTTLLGRSGLSIAMWRELSSGLATAAEMPVKVGVIAADFRVTNPLVGRGDLIVSVEETRLDGAEHLVVPGNHTLLMRDPYVLTLTTRFLKHGRFSSDPLTAPADEQPQTTV